MSDAGGVPGDFASLLPGEEKEKTASEPLSFAALPEAEQALWLAQAENELRENFGLSAWLKTAEKARAGLRRQRAQNLYGQSLSVTGGKKGKEHSTRGKPRWLLRTGTDALGSQGNLSTTT